MDRSPNQIGAAKFLHTENFVSENSNFILCKEIKGNYNEACFRQQPIKSPFKAIK